MDQSRHGDRFQASESPQASDAFRTPPAAMGRDPLNLSTATLRYNIKVKEAPILVLGLFALLPYFYAMQLGDLRAHTTLFLVAYFVSFSFYALACILAVRLGDLSRVALVATFMLGAVMLAILIFTPPKLSDDMYRYVWDGRVQAQGISPYLYSPDSPELRSLRDRTIWTSINRKSAITVYPPLTELLFAILWKILPDKVRWFQLVMASGALLGGVILYFLLKTIKIPTSRLVIYLWSPLLIYEAAHSAHLEGLLMPLLIAAWWARWKKADGISGLLLGMATAIKLYPAVLFPALWRPRHRQARWSFPLVFFSVLGGSYVPYIITSGSKVIGFLPQYLRELFNQPPHVRLIHSIFKQLELDWRSAMVVLSFIVLASLGLWILARQARPEDAFLRRSAWLIGAFSLLSHNLFSWYMLWLLPLVAIFLFRPGEQPLNAWTGWWLFCGSIALSYTFFLDWKEITWAIWAQYLPLYLLLCMHIINYLTWIRSSKWKEPGILTI